MESDAAIQAKIAALSGQINHHKQAQPPVRYNSHSAPHPYPTYAGRGVARWSPYSQGGRAAYSVAHKNRTLVLGGRGANTNATTPDVKTAEGRNPSQSEGPIPANSSFVSTRTLGKNSLMTKDTYDRERKQKLEYQEAKQQGGLQYPTATRPRATSKPHEPTPSQSIKPMVQKPRELEIQGIKFHVKDDGSKLIRVTDPGTTKTPKKVKIADVDFLRTKHGNLVRASSFKRDASSSVKPVKKAQCENFTKYGTCTFGPRCRFAHNPRKIAICKEFLRSGTCVSGPNCDLSHEPTYHRVPACSHFIRGNCTNNACRYPHVHVSPAAPVCRPFATLGYCSKGPECDKRHAFECPDYSNRGFCANREKDACPLPHIDRASTLRKADERRAKTGAENDSDASSDESDGNAEEEESGEEYDSDGLDSDASGDVMMSGDDSGRALMLQQDFISF